MIHRISSLIIKELQEQCSTVRGVLVLIMPIIFQTLLFPFVATQDVTHCSVAVYCEDSGAAATELVQRIAAAPYIAEVHNVYGWDALMQQLDDRNAMVAVNIPADFSRCLQRGEPASLQITGDGLRSNSSQIAAGYIAAIANGLLQQNNGSTPAPTLRHIYNPTLNYKWFIIPCLLGMLAMLTSMNISCMALAKEREAGTYEQLCVTPYSPFELLIGKTLPAVMILLVQCSVILCIALWGYRLPMHGSVACMYLALALYSFALSGIGLSISSFCNTQQQAFIGMFCFVLPAVLLSGFVSPVENMPTALQYISRVNPLFYIFTVTRGVFLKGYGIADILPQLTAFCAIGAVTISSAYLILRLRGAR